MTAVFVPLFAENCVAYTYLNRHKQTYTQRTNTHTYKMRKMRKPQWKIIYLFSYFCSNGQSKFQFKFSSSAFSFNVKFNFLHICWSIILHRTIKWLRLHLLFMLMFVFWCALTLMNGFLIGFFCINFFKRYKLLEIETDRERLIHHSYWFGEVQCKYLNKSLFSFVIIVDQRWH